MSLHATNEVLCLSHLTFVINHSQPSTTFLKRSDDSQQQQSHSIVRPSSTAFQTPEVLHLLSIPFHNCSTQVNHGSFTNCTACLGKTVLHCHKGWRPRGQLADEGSNFKMPYTVCFLKPFLAPASLSWRRMCSKFIGNIL